MTRLEKLLSSGAGGALGDLVRRARAMDDLTLALRSALGGEAATHLVSANLHGDGELVLVCSSPAWAARIRFESAALLDAAGKRGVRADRCSVKVARK